MASSVKSSPLLGRNIKQEAVVHVICKSPPSELSASSASSFVPPVTGKEVVVVTEDMPSTSNSPSGQETGQSKNMCPDSTGIDSAKDERKAGGGKVGSSSKKKMCEKDSDEYKRRRERNNEAVRKSRQKSRQKASETEMRVTELKKENADLEQRVTLLHKELELLKDLFLTHANELPDPSTTFGLFSANPNLGSSSPNPALSRVVLKTDTLTVSLSCKNVPESITTTT
ncbi:CCAAT/enhancer-binding protein beta-like [Lytechinus pictus]|uniref:CCAAT/enhancer-binding protein beta-like n=1 Tax=Lytechinus pictus TaxID=7653 RepID=UPI00240E212A|nr:CCAAT/enhancer-binding protein beta-like [Lytechinus pictus]